MSAPCLCPTDWLAQLVDQVHVWHVNPDALTDPALLARYAATLSPDEEARRLRFRFEQDCHQFLVSHALVRQVLSKYADVPPSEWQFTAGPRGRPEISTPVADLPLRFNLTHTAGLAACVVTLNTDCGIDAEKLSLPANARGIADKMFSASERQALASLRGPDYVSRFFASWTLREAYGKAIGLGLAHPMASLEFECADDLAIRLHTGNPGPDEAGHWQFALLQPTPEHLAAIALRHDNAEGEKSLRLLPFEAA
ncbi:MAG: 4'-phosphopantetheinyl transferase superfamily protein [Thiobacillus sp.]